MVRAKTRADVRRWAYLCTVALVVSAVLAAPGRAYAQSDKWQVDAAPLYLWASELDGRLSVNEASLPIFLSFGDALDTLAGAFSFHVEARKNRWGILSDLNFIRLSTDTNFTTPILSRPVEGTAQLDMTVFEIAAMYLVSPSANFSVIGGLRTYTLSPRLEFEGNIRELTVVDTGRTSADVFGGFTYRPKLSEKWLFLSRADLGAGEANFTWSGTLGFEFQFKPWGGVTFGYRALGIDTGNVSKLETLPAATAATTEYDVTHYGPMFAFTLHWTQK